MNKKKEPLYRKMNSTAHGIYKYRNLGGDYSEVRNTKANKEHGLKKMKRGVERGLDYTPLYRFLQSKEGCYWPDVHSEAISRLDKQDPIWRMVLQSKNDDPIMAHANDLWHTMYVDDENILRFIDRAATVKESSHCTKTLNGKPIN